MKTVIERDGAKQQAIGIYNRLWAIEVKGDSVDHLYIARAMLKELIECMTEIETEDTKEKEG